MFLPLQTEVDARFAGIKSFFGATKHFRGEAGLIAKGLVFVQLYAVYEYTVKSAVQTAIDSINAFGYKMKDMKPSLMALYLDPEFKSLLDSSEKRVWNARLKIFERVFSNDVIALSNATRAPSDGSHYRHSHLLLIFEVFGIKRSPARRQSHLHRIDEVVDHRNQIAHGSETASEVGRRYTREEIHQRIRQMESVCKSLVSAVDQFCCTPSLHKR